MAKVFTADDVKSHNKSSDLYIIVDGDVYDITGFQDEHPGMSDSHLPRQLHQSLLAFVLLSHIMAIC